MSEEPAFRVGDMVIDVLEKARNPNSLDIGVVTDLIHNNVSNWVVYGYWRQDGEWQRGILTCGADSVELHPDPDSVWPEFMAWILVQ